VRPRNKMVQFKKTNRKAISPIIATVLIIAITLIAAVAIGGFVFGLFGATSSTAQIQVVNAVVPLSAVTTGGTTIVPSACATGAPGGAYLALTNLGSASASVTSISMTFSGVTLTSQVSGCSIAAGATVYLPLSITALSKPNAGTQYSGFVVTSNGAQVLFTGAFQ
jgi:flagellin-like protein